MGNNQIILNKVPVLLSGIAPLLLCVCFCLCVRRMCMCAWFCVWRMSACLWFYVCDVCAQFPASSKTFLLLWTRDDCMWQKCTVTCTIKQFHLIIFPSEWNANVSILSKSASHMNVAPISLIKVFEMGEATRPLWYIWGVSHILPTRTKMENIGDKSYKVLSVNSILYC